MSRDRKAADFNSSEGNSSSSGWKRGEIKTNEGFISFTKKSVKENQDDPLYFTGIGDQQAAVTSTTGMLLGGQAVGEKRRVLANIKNKNTLAALLDNIDDITAITSENIPEANRAFVKQYIRKLLKQLDHQSNLTTDRLNRIKDAIAELSGVDDRTPEEKALRNYNQSANFLDDDSRLVFKNFDRAILTLQLVARLIEPRRINQRQEQICGVNAMMYAIAQDEPLIFARYVTNLASTGEAKLSFGVQQGISVKITDKQVVNRPRRVALLRQDSTKDFIDDVDFISLVGFRASQNDIFKFTENSSAALKSLFGVTFNSEIQAWMTKTGYSHVSQIKLKKPGDIQRLGALIEDGYSAVFCTTADLTDRIVFGTESEETPNKLKQILLDGHLVKIKHISFDEKNNNIKISILTWGEETAEAVIPFDRFKKIAGLSIATTGISPYRNHEIREQIKRISLSDPNRIHPQTFITRVKTDLITAIDWYGDDNLKKKREGTIPVQLPNTTYYVPYFLGDLIATIENTISHDDGLTWQQGARAIQDILLAIDEEKELSAIGTRARESFLAAREKALNLIVTSDATAGEFLSKEINPDPAKVDEKQLKRLHEAVAALHDPGCLRKLVEVLVYQNKLTEALDLINKEKDQRRDNGAGPHYYSSAEIAFVTKALDTQKSARASIVQPANQENISQENDDRKKIDFVIRHYEQMLSPESQSDNTVKKIHFIISELHANETNSSLSASSRLDTMTAMLNRMADNKEPRPLENVLKKLDSIIRNPEISVIQLKDRTIPGMTSERAEEAMRTLISQIERAERSYMSLKNAKGRHHTDFRKVISSINQVIQNKKGKLDADAYHFAMQELIKAYRNEEKNFCLPYLGFRKTPQDFVAHLNMTPNDFEYPRLLAVLITDLMMQYPEFKTTNLPRAFQHTVDLIKDVKPGDNLIYLRLLSNDQSRITLGKLLGKIKRYPLSEKQIDTLLRTKPEYLDKRITSALPLLEAEDIQSLKHDITEIQMMGKDISANLKKFRRSS